MKWPVINFLDFCHEYNDPKKFVRAYYCHVAYHIFIRRVILYIYICIVYNV